MCEKKKNGRPLKIVTRQKTQRLMNVVSGGGSVSKRVALAKSWLNHIGIEDDKYVELELMDDAIIIRKAKKPDG